MNWTSSSIFIIFIHVPCPKKASVRWTGLENNPPAWPIWPWPYHCARTLKAAAFEKLGAWNPLSTHHRRLGITRPNRCGTCLSHLVRKQRFLPLKTAAKHRFFPDLPRSSLAGRYTSFDQTWPLENLWSFRNFQLALLQIIHFSIFFLQSRFALQICPAVQPPWHRTSVTASPQRSCTRTWPGDLTTGQWNLWFSNQPWIRDLDLGSTLTNFLMDLVLFPLLRIGSNGKWDMYIYIYNIGSNNMIEYTIIHSYILTYPDKFNGTDPFPLRIHPPSF